MGFPRDSVVKNPPVNAGAVGSIHVQEDPLENEMATHFSILAWEIPWTEEPGGYSPLTRLLRPWDWYWSGLPFPSPGDLPDPGIEPRSPALQADALTSEPPGKHI